MGENDGSWVLHQQMWVGCGTAGGDHDHDTARRPRHVRPYAPWGSRTSFTVSTAAPRKAMNNMPVQWVLLMH